MVRVSRPAPVRRMTETAIWATTSARWSRCLRRLALSRVAPDAITFPSEPSLASEGAYESSTATASVRSSVKASTIASRLISLARGE